MTVSTGRSPAATRDLRLDFFRGVALVCIFIDHIPENYLNYFTLSAIGFYDAAEVFIFISGFTAALVYGRAAAVRGVVVAIFQVLRRAWQLYVAHIFLFVIFVAEVSYTVMTFKNPMYNEEMGVGDFLTEPHIAVVRALLLQFQPTFLDILPLYIMLLLVFPLILLGLRRHALVVLIPSAVLYVAVQALHLDVPAYPVGRTWTFNPLAWQFLFVSGAALGYASAFGRDLTWWSRRVYLPALIIVAVTLVIRLTWTAHALWEPIPGLLLRQLWPINKSNLAPIRLITFLATVVVVARWVQPQARFLRGILARPLELCGSHSLEIFCLSIVLSALAHFLLSEFNSGVIMQVSVNVVGLATMWATAAFIEWYRSMQRMPTARPAATQSGGASGGE